MTKLATDAVTTTLVESTVMREVRMNRSACSIYSQSMWNWINDKYVIGR